MQKGTYTLSCLHCSERILLSPGRVRQLAQTRKITCGECGHTAHYWQHFSDEDRRLPVAEYLYRAMSAF